MAVEAQKTTVAPKAAPKAAPPPKDPNEKNIAPKVEVEKTPEEKKVEAQYAKLEEEAIGKTSKVNLNLAKDGKAERISYEVRNGEIVYMWVNIVPTRILTEDEVKAIGEVRA